ncbi:hypothetical protein ACJMK2_008874 [Sinanodonta woodiana]|uniref:Uncharacterized protein n=1 Tax=Sinanodonta woodiana TaxID=1069815 RepID=A0ABD3VCC0_SINWO
MVWKKKLQQIRYIMWKKNNKWDVVETKWVKRPGQMVSIKQILVNNTSELLPQIKHMVAIVPHSTMGENTICFTNNQSTVVYIHCIYGNNNNLNMYTEIKDRKWLCDMFLDEEKSSSAGESLSLPTPKNEEEEEEEGSDSLDSDDDANDEKDEGINSDASSSVRISKTILFTHSKVQPETNEASLQNNPDLPQEGPTIQTPADIIRLVTVANVPKSILKNRDTIPVNLEAAEPEYMGNNLVKATEKDSSPASSVMAFSGKVMEKEPAVQDLEVDAKPKKMSKLRAQRQSQAPR